MLELEESPVHCYFQCSGKKCGTTLCHTLKMASGSMRSFASVLLLTAGCVMVMSSPISMTGKEIDQYLAPFSGQTNHRQTRADETKDCDSPTPVYPPTVVDTTTRLAALRVEMAKYNFDAYLVPSEDAHGSEYVSEHDERRTYISGLSGSAGFAIVTATNGAYIWTDGRYFVQAERELDCNWNLMKQGLTDVPNPDEWIAKNMANGSRIGFDPTVISATDYVNYISVFAAEKDKVLFMVSETTNLVDTIWSQDTEVPQPSYPTEPLKILDSTIYTGETWKQKIFSLPGNENVRAKMKNLEPDAADVLVISALDETAWLFNMRSRDIPYNPMIISYLIITEDSIKWYVNGRDTRATSEVLNHLEATGCTGAECTQFLDYSQFLPDLKVLGDSDSIKKIWFSDLASYAIYERVPEEKQIMSQSPILLMKAMKSEKEIEGMKRAHLKDSVALVELGGWLQETFSALEDPAIGSDTLTELEVERMAYEFRKDDEEFDTLSFGTISGFGANAAVIHYSSSEETNVRITDKSTLLLDSGGQYFSGTTDITRTFHFGTPKAKTKEAYTRVLMGHIDLVTSNFRSNVYGRALDVIARNPLWSNGLDYRHGTGHGIGSFLNVHEATIGVFVLKLLRGLYPSLRYFNSLFSGLPKLCKSGLRRSLSLKSILKRPARISLGYSSREKPIEVGMFFSDEPGYYEDGDFGIRIENVMMSVEAETDHQFYTYKYMTFEMISLVPFEPNLIDFGLMTPKQLTYYNHYNKRIRQEVGPLLKTDRARQWMNEKTAPVEFKFELVVSTATTPSAGMGFISALLFLVWTLRMG
ncbi:xaa-Pro aminopeptidase 1-like [Acanthaster planci]|uniref:Xaa-Pro aminopeptidase 1-like n=1 Tax=Acanthaster planci TaxID=133434 RepID=A0A8B7Y9Y6_ACAPL|nr:xaa-Pro aminopeptidase 1-like [Acanthaster planci]